MKNRDIVMKLILLCLLIMVTFKLLDSVNVNSHPGADYLKKGVLNNQVKSEIFVKVNHKDGSHTMVNLDDYLVGVVAGEMPSSFHDEALKAQIIASRTYVANRNFDVTDDVMTQVYLSEEQMINKWGDNYIEEYNRIKDLVLETDDTVMVYNGELISALFFSTSNGRTEKASNYWSSEVPYLQSVSSPWDADVSPRFNDSKEFTMSELSDIFDVSNLHIEILSLNENERVKEVAVNGEVYTGRQIRELLGLRSNDFTIERNNDKVIFHTRGFGHGVGMSQYGAQGMALEGYLHAEILLHYYTGINFLKL